jgi:hypothetical protein
MPLDSGVRGPGTGLRDMAIDSCLFAIVRQNSILGLSHLQVTASPRLGDTDLLSSCGDTSTIQPIADAIQLNINNLHL